MAVIRSCSFDPQFGCAFHGDTELYGGIEYSLTARWCRDVDTFCQGFHRSFIAVLSTFIFRFPDWVPSLTYSVSVSRLDWLKGNLTTPGFATVLHFFKSGFSRSGAQEFQFRCDFRVGFCKHFPFCVMLANKCAILKCSVIIKRHRCFCNFINLTSNDPY